MNKIAKILAVGAIPFLIQGCTGTAGSSNAVNTQKQPPAAQKPPSQPKEPVTPVATNTVFADNNAGNTNTQFSGLIAATNSELRVQGVVKGRNDPFALFPVAGKLKKVESEEKKTVDTKKVETAKVENDKPKANKAVNTPKKIVTPNVKATNKPKKVVDMPSSKPVNPTTKKPAVVIPQPELARAVEISGIIDIDGKAIAIIKSPDDASSQYVEAGQYIANGKILVKQIISYPEAKVILQQVGIKGDVVKGVTENSPVAQNDDKPAASFAFVENLPQ